MTFNPNVTIAANEATFRRSSPCCHSRYCQALKFKAAVAVGTARVLTIGNSLNASAGAGQYFGGTGTNSATSGTGERKDVALPAQIGVMPNAASIAARGTCFLRQWQLRPAGAAMAYGLTTTADVSLAAIQLG